MIVTINDSEVLSKMKFTLNECEVSDSQSMIDDIFTSTGIKMTARVDETSGKVTLKRLLVD